MDIEIPIQGQSASGGVPPVQPPVPPIQPSTQPPVTPNPSTPPNPPTNDVINRVGGSWSTDQNRMIEDVRREMQQRGVLMVPGSSSMAQIINQYGSNLRQQTQQSIRNEYDQSRTQLTDERDKELKSLKDKRERLITDRYNKFRSVGGTLQDAEEWYDNTYGLSDRKKKREINERYNENLKEINAEEREVLKDSDKELISAIKDLTRYFERESRGGINQDSYINQLKKQREEAIFERDNADDEEQAREAARRVNELNDKIKDVMNEGEEEDEPKKKDFGARVLQMMSGVNQLTSGIANRNIGSMITGAGGVITNLIPMSDEGQNTAMKWISGLGMVGTILGQFIERENQMGGLAAVMRGGANLAGVRSGLYKELYKFQTREDLPSIFEMGLDETAFAKSAERRISQRGIGGWKGVEEAYYQEGLERALSLSSGSLGQAGMFDRYGVNATDAISNLVAALERDRFSGVRKGDYARVDEYLRLQQSIMQSQLGFAGTPSYNYANQMISRFANFEGYTVDSRTGGEIQSLQNMVLNPQNDRQKAILYGVVEKLYPSTRGRMDLIEQAIQDPNKMAEIQQAYIRDIQQRYGGTDTELGYFAAKAALPGINSATRRNQIWNGIQQDYYNFAEGGVFKEEYMRDVKDYVSDITSTLTQIQEFVYGIFNFANRLIGGEPVNIKSN